MNDVKEIKDMPAEVDFSDSIPNPYVGKVRRRATINLDGDWLVKHAQRPPQERVRRELGLERRKGHE